MIRKLIIALILLCVPSCLAQTTQVTATVTDPFGSAYANGTYNVFLTDNAGNYLSSGVVWIGNSSPVAPLNFSGTMDSTGTFTVPLAQNQMIQAPSPATGTLWQFNICSQKPPSAGSSTTSYSLIGPQKCVKYSTAVSGTTLNLSSALSALTSPIYYFNALTGGCAISTGLCGTGSGGGGVLPGAQYIIPFYPSTGTNPIVGPSPITGDVAGDLNVPATTTSHRYGNLPSITIPDDCPTVTGNGITDDSTALQACVAAHHSVEVKFRKTQPPNTCDYFFAQPLAILGDDAQWDGVSGGSGSGVRLCFAPDVSGLWCANSSSQQCHIHHLNIQGGNHWSSVVLADYVVPQIYGGTGSNAVGIIANADGMTVDHMHIGDFSSDGIYVQSSQPLGAPIATATWSGGTATVTTTVGHGCATGMAMQVTGISGLTGSTTSVRVNGTFVTSTIVTFPASGSGSFSGGGAQLACGDFLSTLGIYAVADEGSFEHNWVSGNRGNGEAARGGDSSDWTFGHNQLLSNQLAGVREASFLGNAHIREQTDADGWDLTTPLTPTYAMTSTSTASNSITFTSSDPNLINNSSLPNQGSHINVTGCFTAGPTPITSAEVIFVGGTPGYWLQVAVTGSQGGAGSITTSGIVLTGPTGGYNFNGTFTDAGWGTNVANNGPGYEFPLFGYTGSIIAPQAQSGANATNYPSQADGDWWISGNPSGGVWTARSNPLRQVADGASGLGCVESVFPGGQVWANANIDGGGGIYQGTASGNTIIHPYCEGDERGIKSGQYDQFVNGDVGCGFDPLNNAGHHTFGQTSTVTTFSTPSSTGVLQGNQVTVGGGNDAYDVMRWTEQSCALGDFENNCGMTLSNTIASTSFATGGEHWFGFNGGQFASNSLAGPFYFPLLLGYAQTTETTVNHPYSWFPNGFFFNYNGVHPAQSVTWTSTAPTSACTVGSIQWNTNPISNGVAEWVCTVSSGTWQPVNYGSGSGVTSINANGGAFTFSGAGVSCTGTTCTFSGSGSGIGSIAWSLPSWLSASPSTISASGTQTFSAATGQTAHQVIGTCGSATSFGPCSLVAGDIPALSYVTSVALSMPGIFSVSGSPVTSSGTLAVSLATQIANTVWAGPASGGVAPPTFRTLVPADIPEIGASLNCANYASVGDMSQAIATCLTTLFAISPTGGIADATGFTGNQTWSINPFAGQTPGTTIPWTGELRVCSTGTITLNVPIVQANYWRIVGCGTAQGAGSKSAAFTANSGTFQATYSTGTVTMGTPGASEVVTGSGTTWTSSMIGCAFVSPSTQPTSSNSTYGIIHAVGSTTSLTLGYGANNGTGAPSSSNYAIYCPMVLMGTDGAGAGSPPAAYTGIDEHLSLNCNNVAGCVDVMNWYGEEGVDLIDATLTGYTNIGYDIESNYAQNSSPGSKIILTPGSSCSASTISYVNRTHAVATKPLKDSSINNPFCSTKPNVGLDIQGSNERLENLHIENYVAGISVSNNTSCAVACAQPPTQSVGFSAEHINAAAAGTNVVSLGTTGGSLDGLTLSDITVSAGGTWTHVLADTGNSCTDTATRIGSYLININGGIQQSTSTTTSCQASPVFNNLALNGNVTTNLVVNTGGSVNSTQIGTNLFAALPTCNSGAEGTMAPVTDSTTNTWGATITGSGSDHVLAYCDGSAWTVAAK